MSVRNNRVLQFSTYAVSARNENGALNLLRHLEKSAERTYVAQNAFGVG